MRIEYKIKFLDYWHISSGKSGGALYDMLVLKDKNKLPYIPGRTIKGLVRDNAFQLGLLTINDDKEEFNDKDLEKCLGNDKVAGECYFSNLYLDEKEKNSIVSNNLQNFLYDRLTFTALNEKKVAKDDSLREFEVVIPISLEGYVDVCEECKEKIKNLLKMIKRAGLDRRRGLGRCEIIIKDEK